MLLRMFIALAPGEHALSAAEGASGTRGPSPEEKTKKFSSFANI